MSYIIRKGCDLEMDSRLDPSAFYVCMPQTLTSRLQGRLTHYTPVTFKANTTRASAMAERNVLDAVGVSHSKSLAMQTNPAVKKRALRARKRLNEERRRKLKVSSELPDRFSRTVLTDVGFVGNPLVVRIRVSR